MTRAHFYASTVRNIKDVVQYAIYPAAKTLAVLSGQNSANATLAASAVSSAAYAGLTSVFGGLEAGMFDENVREAVAAEMGKKPQEVQFSDYWNSQNSIVKKETRDLAKFQQYRYATDAVGLVPLAVDWVGHMNKGWKEARLNGTNNTPVLGGMNANEALSRSGDLVYATKAAYWLYEQFFVPKTAHYDIVKVRELLESTGKDISYNDVFSIFQRARDDQNLPQFNHEEKEALRPVIDRMVSYYNDEKIGVPEMVYLMGMNKINIYDKQYHISPEAIDHSMAEIEKVATIGLPGIARENAEMIRQMRLQGKQPEQPALSFVEQFSRAGTDFAYGTYKMFLEPKNPSQIERNGKGKKRVEEWISSRDPADPAYTPLHR